LERVQVTAGQVDILLGLGEDYYVDYKAREVQPAKLSKWVSAFANSSGGDIYVGVDEPSPGVFVWRGFGRPEDANAHVSTLQELFPPSDSFAYYLLSAADQPGYVLKVEVSKTRDIRVATDKKAYRRAGASVQAVQSEEGLGLLRLQKGITSHEQVTVDAPIDIISDSYQVTEFVSTVVPLSEAEPWLKKQLLIREGKPTVAGMVLFADEPQTVLPKASVIVYRYASDEQTGSRDRLVGSKTHLIEGSAYAQIAEAVRLTSELIEEVKDQDLQPVQYPTETLHEIITNAVIHRDYSMKDNVHVRVFDDRVEVESPGPLPGHVTPQNILNARFSRNETIERLLHKFPNPPNKNVGEGLNTAFDAMTKMRLADPEIVERGDNVLVYIRHQPLDSPATLVLNHLTEKGTINNGQGRALTGIARDPDMRKVFERMIEQGAIERVPGTIKGGSKYRLRGSSAT
jgi:ATP-dependent DNA helicase RecG